MKATAYFSHDSWSPERGLRPEPPAKKAEILPIRPLRFVKDTEDKDQSTPYQVCL